MLDFLTQPGLCVWLLLLHTCVFPISSDGPPLQSQQVGAPPPQLQVAKSRGSIVRLCGKSSGQKMLDFVQPKPSWCWSGRNIWFSVTPGLKFWRDLPDMSVREHSGVHPNLRLQPSTESQNHNLCFINNKNYSLNTVQCPK